MSSKSPHEDWAVVWLGFLIIAFILFVQVISPPSLGWANSGELSTKVFSASNIGKILTQFVFVYSIGILTMVITGKALKPFLIVFPVIFILAITAMIITGNSFIKDTGLEAVIFSLSLGLIIGNAFKLPQWFRSSL